MLGASLALRGEGPHFVVLDLEIVVHVIPHPLVPRLLGSGATSVSNDGRSAVESRVDCLGNKERQIFERAGDDAVGGLVSDRFKAVPNDLSSGLCR